MTRHMGCPIPSPALMERIGTRFRGRVRGFAGSLGVPVVHFAKDDRKIDVMRPLIEAQARTGRSVAVVGVAQEFQNVFASAQRQSSGGAPSSRSSGPTDG